MKNMPYTNFLAAVESAIAGSPGQNVYLLLDQAGIPSVARELRKYPTPRVSLFEGTKDRAASDVGPVLVLIAENGNRIAAKSLFLWLSKYAGDTSSTIIIVSPLTINMIHIRLSARLKVKLSEEMDALFRFYDPRVLAALPIILGEHEKEVFFGLASCWIYPNRSGGLETLTTTFRVDDDFNAPLALSSQQEFAFIAASEIDQVLDLLRTILPLKMAEISVSEQYHSVKKIICDAQLVGITSTLGCAIFAGMFIKGGSKMADSPVVAEVIKELQSEKSDILKLNDLIDSVFLE